MPIKQRLKGALLTLFTNYGQNSERYWNLRWRLGYDVEKGLQKYRNKWESQIVQIMREEKCESFLDVGCGKAWLRNLSGYLGMDASREVFKQNQLSGYLVADATKKIPLPSKSFDVSGSFCMLMHQPPVKVLVAISEITRVTKKVIVLKELTEPTANIKLKHHCFKHNYDELFGDFDGKLVMLEW